MLAASFAAAPLDLSLWSISLLFTRTPPPPRDMRLSQRAAAMAAAPRLQSVTLRFCGVGSAPQQRLQQQPRGQAACGQRRQHSAVTAVAAPVAPGPAAPTSPYAVEMQAAVDAVRLASWLCEVSTAGWRASNRQRFARTAGSVGGVLSTSLCILAGCRVQGCWHRPRELL